MLLRIVAQIRLLLTAPGALHEDCAFSRSPCGLLILSILHGRLDFANL